MAKVAVMVVEGAATGTVVVVTGAGDTPEEPEDRTAMVVAGTEVGLSDDTSITEPVPEDTTDELETTGVSRTSVHPPDNTAANTTLNITDFCRIEFPSVPMKHHSDPGPIKVTIGWHGSTAAACLLCSVTN